MSQVPKYRERLMMSGYDNPESGMTRPGKGEKPNNLRRHLLRLAESGVPFKGRWKGLDRARVELILDERITPTPYEAAVIAHLLGATEAELFPHMNAAALSAAAEGGQHG